ncbi:hypothetical protein V2J09_013660 [Rumex salicifolius]
MENGGVSSENQQYCDTTAIETEAAASKGGWITSPFLLGTMLGLTVAAGGWYSNLIVFLMNEFNVKSIEAAQINNIASGFTSFFPIVGAILADSLWSSYTVTIVSSFLSLLGVIMFTMIVTINALKPQSCDNASSSMCASPTSYQNAFLYAAITIASLGIGGTRFILTTMGASQLKKAKHQGMFLDWIIFTLYIGWIIGYTVLVYVQDNVSWTLGFGISIAANVIGIALFVCGTPFYRRIMPQGSPFTSIARVFVASFRKFEMVLPLDAQNVDCYYYQNLDSKVQYGPPSKILRFLNRAAMREQSDAQEEIRAEKGKSWRLCSVEEVEDLKKLIKVLPIWASGIFYSVPLGIHLSVIVLQALVMDRHMGSHFEIPAGTFVVFTLLVAAITIPTIERLFFPLWKKVTGKSLRPLQRIGIGHSCNVLGMVVFALIERKRLSLLKTDHLLGVSGSVAPMSALWLVLPLSITGIGEAFQFPGEVALHYQEFPKSLRSTSAAIVSFRIAIAYYLSAVFVSLFQETTSWLPNDINHGRVDNVYWTIALVGFVNFMCYVTYAMFYRYSNLNQS